MDTGVTKLLRSIAGVEDLGVVGEGKRTKPGGHGWDEVIYTRAVQSPLLSFHHRPMAHRYSPPPHPHPERTASFNPLAHLLQHLADSPPTTPVAFTRVDLDQPSTHDPEDILREIRADGDNPFPIDRTVLKKVVEKKMAAQVEAISFLSSGARFLPPNSSLISTRPS